MAQVEVIPDSVISELHQNFCECINYPKFLGFGWENLYKFHMTNVIKILQIHTNSSRLYKLIQLDSSRSVSDAISKLNTKRLIQFPRAIELTKSLKDILPDADPIYLDIIGEFYAYNHDALSELIEKLTTKNKSYPKVQEYNEHVKTCSIVNSLTENFSVQEFLRLCPDPVNYFMNIKLNSDVTHTNESLSYLSYKFGYVPISVIRAHLFLLHYNLTKTFEKLEKPINITRLRNKRKTLIYQKTNLKLSDNIEFLKEIAYLEHKNEILNHIESEKTVHNIQVEEAKSLGKLITCQCCYNSELLSSEVNSCPAGHQFCSSCIKKGIEVSVGTGKIDFKCFADCNEEFNLTMIENIVDEKLYRRIMRLKQAQEIKAADIEGLEQCAFCDYSVILSPDHKTINCLNPKCKKETCRECREESHFPYKCDETEKAPEVEVRLMIENKMTEVLIRTCYNCGRKFVKEDGCNKMTCSCGKRMCYICRKPVDNSYLHFYHSHFIEDKCPLYTEENIVHTTAVEAVARLTVNELKVKKPELLKKINIDKILPTLNHTKKIANASVLNINRVVATVTGQNLEDINNQTDMRSMEPQLKKARH